MNKILSRTGVILGFERWRQGLFAEHHPRSSAHHAQPIGQEEERMIYWILTVGFMFWRIWKHWTDYRGRQGQSNDFNCLCRPHQIYFNQIVNGNCYWRTNVFLETIPDLSLYSPFESGDSSQFLIYHSRTLFWRKVSFCCCFCLWQAAKAQINADGWLTFEK